MHNFLQPSHFFIGAIATLALLGVGYATLPQTPSHYASLPLVAAVGESNPSASGAIPTQASAAGFEVEDQLLSQILEINTIKLDTNFFQSPIFTSLVDFSRDLVAQPVGRLDPFAPVNGSAATSRASSSPAR